MFQPNYRDFYQKALVPICSTDESSRLQDKEEESFTHWLIALSGYLKNSSKEFYTWKVVVYPANKEGRFNWGDLHYYSEDFDCFHKAYEVAVSIEEKSRNEEFAPTKVREKIS